MRYGILFLALVALIGGVFAPAAVAAINGLGASGHDVVAYFDMKPGARAVKGNARYQAKHSGTMYYFASQENLDKFRKDPSAYAPQYDGYCAYGVTEGAKIKSDPNAWSIYQGKLYLNYNRSMRVMWTRNKDANIESANANWPRVKNRH